MNNTIYLSGTHRTGKTYLAHIAAHCLSINFKEAKLSEVYGQLNTQPQSVLAPTMYLPIQELMLVRMNSNSINSARIVDRSHVDLAAYAIYHLRNNPELNSWLTDYVDRCLSSIDKDAVIVSVPISSLNIEDTSKSFTKDSAQAIEDILQGLYLHPTLKAKIVRVPVQTTKIYERVQIIDDILQEQKLTNKVSDTTIIGTTNTAGFYIDSTYVPSVNLLGVKP
ncbi:MAG: hypothetical protein RR575_00300 [Acinetobacter sp.]